MLLWLDDYLSLDVIKIATREDSVLVELKMRVSKAELYNQRVWELQKDKQKASQEESYRKLVETRKFEDIIAERVSRNLRLNLEKGRHIDIEC